MNACVSLPHLQELTKLTAKVVICVSLDGAEAAYAGINHLATPMRLIDGRQMTFPTQNEAPRAALLTSFLFCFAA
jgi:hypothetical protein